jgi:hypothetical protein
MSTSSPQDFRIILPFFSCGIWDSPPVCFLNCSGTFLVSAVLDQSYGFAGCYLLPLQVTPLSCVSTALCGCPQPGMKTWEFFVSPRTASSKLLGQSWQNSFTSCSGWLYFMHWGLGDCKGHSLPVFIRPYLAIPSILEPLRNFQGSLAPISFPVRLHTILTLPVSLDHLPWSLSTTRKYPGPFYLRWVGPLLSPNSISELCGQKRWFKQFAPSFPAHKVQNSETCPHWGLCRFLKVNDWKAMRPALSLGADLYYKSVAIMIVWEGPEKREKQGAGPLYMDNLQRALASRVRTSPTRLPVVRR